MSTQHLPRAPEDGAERELLRALRALGKGDLSVRMTPTGGVDAEVAQAFNDAVHAQRAMLTELGRLRDVASESRRAGPGGHLVVAGGAASYASPERRVAGHSAMPDVESGLSRNDPKRDGFRGEPAGLARPDNQSPGTGLARIWRRAANTLNRLAAHPEKPQNRVERRRRNRRLDNDARHLADRMRQVEYRNREVELARVAVQQKAEQLALSSRYKTEFLANMSHELRTPLNSLLILAQMLAENPASNLTPKQVEYAQTIHAAGKDLLALINDVLDLAKVESGTVTLEMATEHLAELRDFLDRAFRQVGHDKGLKFSILLEKGLPSAIGTDAKRLRQILKNLLSNAFKFTPKGSVSLRIAPASSGWTRGHGMLDAASKVVSFSVVDTGIGIAPHLQEIIFEAFQQGDGTTSRQFGGTGLGLSISSGLARLMGGEIKVKSSPGEGSTFTLYLPLPEGVIADASEPVSLKTDFVIEGDRNDQRESGAVIEPLSPAQDIGEFEPATSPRIVPELAGVKVLLVDDDIRNIFALTSVLEDQGMVVVYAESGLDGIETLRRDPPIDIVLMDMMMPVLDGYDTIRIMRRLENVGQVPIIGISARAMKGDREKCIEAGASEYVPKPVDVDHLLAVMQKLLSANKNGSPRIP